MAFYAPVKMSDIEENKMNKKLPRAMLSGIASQTTLTDNHLVQLYIETMCDHDDALKSLNCCTLLWDGWSDVSHHSIYAFMLLHDYDQSEILDLTNVSNM